MTNSTLDIMTKVETLDTEELEDVLLWVEFTLSKRMDRRQSVNSEDLYFAYLYKNANQEDRASVARILEQQERLSAFPEMRCETA